MRDVQLAYMQGIAPLLLCGCSSMIVDLEDGPQLVELAENIRLFLPSAVPLPLQDSMRDVATKELQLRKAQAEEPLEHIHMVIV